MYRRDLNILLTKKIQIAVLMTLAVIACVGVINDAHGFGDHKLRTIVSYDTGKCLSAVRGDTSKLVMADCEQRYSTLGKWEFSEHTLQFRNVYYGRCIDIHGSTGEVQLWDCKPSHSTSLINQQWSLDRSSGQLVTNFNTSPSPGKRCLDFDPRKNNKVIAYACKQTGSAGWVQQSIRSQQWDVQKVESNRVFSLNTPLVAKTQDKGTYFVHGHNLDNFPYTGGGNGCLGVTPSVSPKGKSLIAATDCIDQIKRRGSLFAIIAKQSWGWSYAPHGENWMALRINHDDNSPALCADVFGWGHSTGDQVGAWECNDQYNQKFEFYTILNDPKNVNPSGDGISYNNFIKPLHALDMCLEVRNHNLSPQLIPSLHLAKCNINLTAQRFDIIPIDTY